MKHAEFENDVIQIVARVTKKDAGTISHDTNLVADLGIDSGSAVVLLGIWLAAEWSKDINNALGRPDEHLLRTIGIVLGAYLLIMVVPYLLLR